MRSLVVALVLYSASLFAQTPVVIKDGRFVKIGWMHLQADWDLHQAMRRPTKPTS